MIAYYVQPIDFYSFVVNRHESSELKKSAHAADSSFEKRNNRFVEMFENR